MTYPQYFEGDNYYICQTGKNSWVRVDNSPSMDRITNVKSGVIAPELLNPSTKEAFGNAFECAMNDLISEATTTNRTS